MNFCVGKIKLIKPTENKLDLVYILRTREAPFYLVPVPTAQHNCDLKSVTTFHGSLSGNKHGDPRFFFQVFAMSSPMKNIFEEEKKFDSRTLFFGENSSLLGVFWPWTGRQGNHGTVRKSTKFPQPGNKKRLK